MFITIDGSDFNKKSNGTDKVKTEKQREDNKTENFQDKVSKNLKIIIDILKEVTRLIKNVTLKKFRFQVVCASNDAAEAAITYGLCCSVAYPLLGMISSIVRVKEKGRDIDIRCEYNKPTGSISYDLVLSVRIFRIAGAFLRILFKEAKRKGKTEK